MIGLIPIDAIYNKIRGLNPFPAAWTNIRNNGVETTAKLYGVKKETKEHSHRNGTILTTNKELKVAVTGGYIYIEEIKIAGKKELTTINLLNGYEFLVGCLHVLSPSTKENNIEYQGSLLTIRCIY